MGVVHYFSLKSQAFDTGNSIHQALGRLHFESTGSENSPAKGFLIHWELGADIVGKKKKRKSQEMEKFQMLTSCTGRTEPMA